MKAEDKSISEIEHIIKNMKVDLAYHYKQTRILEKEIDRLMDIMHVKMDEINQKEQ